MIGAEPGLSFLNLALYALRCAGEFDKHFNDVIKILHAALPLDSLCPALVAGAPEVDKRDCRYKNGIPMPEKRDKHARAICARGGAAYVLT